MVTPILDHSDLERIAGAVAEAERRTTAEIVCVITRRVSAYAETPLAAGIVAALALAPLAVLGLDALPPNAGWRIGHAAAAGLEPRGAVLGYVLLQAALFALAVGLAAVPGLRTRLTPDVLKRSRVRRAAMQQFQAARFGEAGKPGLVIFVALEERQVEIVADAAAHSASGEAVWQEAVEALRGRMRAGLPAEALILAVEICGAALARAFPAAGPDPNTHPDAAIEL